MENEKQLEIAPFYNQASSLHKEVNQILFRLEGEMYRIKQIEARLKEIALNSSEFQEWLSNLVELVKN